MREPHARVETRVLVAHDDPGHRYDVTVLDTGLPAYGVAAGCIRKWWRLPLKARFVIVASTDRRSGGIRVRNLSSLEFREAVIEAAHRMPIIGRQLYWWVEIVIEEE